MDHTQQRHDAARQSIRERLVLVGFLVVAAFFLWTEHRAHVLGALPYFLLLACPLMHLFHHGHRHDGHGKSARDIPTQQEPGEKS